MLMPIGGINDVSLKSAMSKMQDIKNTYAKSSSTADEFLRKQLKDHQPQGFRNRLVYSMSSADTPPPYYKLRRAIIWISFCLLLVWVIYATYTIYNDKGAICGNNPTLNGLSYFALAVLIIGGFTYWVSIDQQLKFKSWLRRIPMFWNKAMDSGVTPYFDPEHYILSNGRYAKVHNIHIDADELGLPIVDLSTPLNSFNMGIYRNYYKDIALLSKRWCEANHDKMDNLLRMYLLDRTRIVVVGATCMIVKAYSGEHLLIHKSNYANFIADQRKSTQWNMLDKLARSVKDYQEKNIIGITYFANKLLEPTTSLPMTSANDPVNSYYHKLLEEIAAIIRSSSAFIDLGYVINGLIGKRTEYSIGNILEKLFNANIRLLTERTIKTNNIQELINNTSKNSSDQTISVLDSIRMMVSDNEFTAAVSQDTNLAATADKLILIATKGFTKDEAIRNGLIAMPIGTTMRNDAYPIPLRFLPTYAKSYNDAMQFIKSYNAGYIQKHGRFPMLKDVKTYFEKRQFYQAANLREASINAQLQVDRVRDILNPIEQAKLATTVMNEQLTRATTAKEAISQEIRKLELDLQKLDTVSKQVSSPKEVAAVQNMAKDRNMQLVAKEKHLADIIVVHKELDQKKQEVSTIAQKIATINNNIDDQKKYLSQANQEVEQQLKTISNIESAIKTKTAESAKARQELTAELNTLNIENQKKDQVIANLSKKIDELNGDTAMQEEEKQRKVQSLLNQISYIEAEHAKLRQTDSQNQKKISMLQQTIKDNDMILALAQSKLKDQETVLLEKSAALDVATAELSDLNNQSLSHTEMIARMASDIEQLGVNNKVLTEANKQLSMRSTSLVSELNNQLANKESELNQVSEEKEAIKRKLANDQQIRLRLEEKLKNQENLLTNERKAAEARINGVSVDNKETLAKYQQLRNKNAQLTIMKTLIANQTEKQKNKVAELEDQLRRLNANSSLSEQEKLKIKQENQNQMNILAETQAQLDRAKATYANNVAALQAENDRWRDANNNIISEKDKEIANKIEEHMRVIAEYKSQLKDLADHNNKQSSEFSRLKEVEQVALAEKKLHQEQMSKLQAALEKEVLDKEAQSAQFLQKASQNCSKVAAMLKPALANQTYIFRNLDFPRARIIISDKAPILRLKDGDIKRMTLLSMGITNNTFINDAGKQKLIASIAKLAVGTDKQKGLYPINSTSGTETLLTSTTSGRVIAMMVSSYKAFVSQPWVHEAIANVRKCVEIRNDSDFDIIKTISAFLQNMEIILNPQSGLMTTALKYVGYDKLATVSDNESAISLVLEYAYNAKTYAYEKATDTEEKEDQGIVSEYFNKFIVMMDSLISDKPKKKKSKANPEQVATDNESKYANALAEEINIVNVLPQETPMPIPPPKGNSVKVSYI